MSLDLPAAPDWSALAALARAGRAPLVRFGATPETVAREAAGLVYIATPYSKVAPGPDGLWDYAASYRAMMAARRAWIRLTELGVAAFAPIAVAADQCHESLMLDPLDDAFWTRWCAPFLTAARMVVVPDIDGWRESAGIWAELRAAIGCNKPVKVYAEGVGHG